MQLKARVLIRGAVLKHYNLSSNITNSIIKIKNQMRASDAHSDSFDPDPSITGIPSHSGRNTRLPRHFIAFNKIHHVRYSIRAPHHRFHIPLNGSEVVAMKSLIRYRTNGKSSRPSPWKGGLVTRLSPVLTLFTKSNDIPSLVNLFGDVVYSIGFSNYAVSRIAMTHARFRPRISTETIFAHYPNNWVQHYQQRDYGSIDPVHRAAFTHSVPYRWNDITDLSNAERHVLSEARDAGLASGLSVPIHEVGGNILLVNLSGPPSKVDTAMNLQLASLISTLFYLALDRLAQRSCLGPPLRLSSRQRQCLLWVSHGKTSAEIGTILDISRHTVNYHIGEAMKTLNVHSRTTAAVNAAVYGLIQR